MRIKIRATKLQTDPFHTSWLKMYYGNFIKADSLLGDCESNDNNREKIVITF